MYKHFICDRPDGTPSLGIKTTTLLAIPMFTKTSFVARQHYRAVTSQIMTICIFYYLYILFYVFFLSIYIILYIWLLLCVQRPHLRQGKALNLGRQTTALMAFTMVTVTKLLNDRYPFFPFFK